MVGMLRVILQSECAKKRQIHTDTAIFTQNKIFALLKIGNDNFVFHLPFSFKSAVNLAIKEK